MPLTLETKIEEMKKVGPAYLKRLRKLKLATIRDLFFHFPRRYDDFSQIVPINQLETGQLATILGTVAEIKTIRTFRRKITLTEAIIKDETGSVKAIWFNQPYLNQTLSKGKKVWFAGKAVSEKNVFCFSNPVCEIAGLKEPVHTGRLVPIYHETAGLTSRYIRFLIRPLLYLSGRIKEFLPFSVRKEFDLMDLAKAVRQIHFPDNQTLVHLARQRLAFDEMFLTQLAVLEQKEKLSKEKAVSIPFEQKLIKSFVKKLPFQLTDDQRRSAWEIIKDIEKEKPMNRLLNGDVGSGKTAVAAIAALGAAKAGYQTALMAPTEILAKQHFETFKRLLQKFNLKIGLLTGSENIVNSAKVKRLQMKKNIKAGKINLVIGTHALIQEDVAFKKLALVVVDEQHRFGVTQRAALQKKICQIEDGLPTIPHLLSMTATPIPRTLSLTLYGDLDISLLREMPKGRQKIITRIVPPDQRQKAYDFVRNQIKQKRQVFVICPLIEESEKLSAKIGQTEVKSVTREYEKLSKEIFPDLKIAMLHGRMKVKEKDETMKKFQEGKTDILVSTSVIEVGIDIPNATLMLIESAERFGLAQLHQFRGRIGRGEHQSYCFLFTESSVQKTSRRLSALLTCKDGFELAEKDLKLRGPGDFFGERQWGLPDLTMSCLDDVELIKKARQAALAVLNNRLLNPALTEKIKEFRKIIHLE